MAGERETGESGDKIERINQRDRTSESISKDSLIDGDRQEHQRLHQEMEKSGRKFNTFSDNDDDQSFQAMKPGETLEEYQARLARKNEQETVQSKIDTFGIDFGNGTIETAKGKLSKPSLLQKHQKELVQNQADITQECRAEILELTPLIVESQAKTLEKASKIIEVTSLPGVSPEFRHRVEKWWQSVPEHIRKMAIDSGVKIVVAKRANQIMPNAEATQARRHNEGETYSQQPGFYYNKDKTVVLVEDRELTPGEKHTKEVQRSRGVQIHGIPEPRPLTETAWHELGHALDFAVLKHISSSKEFDDVFTKGMTHLTEYDRRNWHYSLNIDKDGSYTSAKEELLAEIVRVMNTSTERLNDEDKRILEHFSEIVDLLIKRGL